MYLLLYRYEALKNGTLLSKLDRKYQKYLQSELHCEIDFINRNPLLSYTSFSRKFHNSQCKFRALRTGPQLLQKKYSLDIGYRVSNPRSGR